MKKMLPALVASVLVASGASWLLNHFHFLHTPHWGWSLFLMVLLFASLGYYYSSRETPADLVPALLAGFAVRFLAGLVFLLIAFLVVRDHFIPLAAHFMTHWFLFTIAEIAYLPNPRSRTTHTS